MPPVQVGHRDFDVEKKLRRDLKRTHALLADAQLLLSTVDSQRQELPGGTREQVERLHCQVTLGFALRPGTRCVRCISYSPALSMSVAD